MLNFHYFCISVNQRPRQPNNTQGSNQRPIQSNNAQGGNQRPVQSNNAQDGNQRPIQSNNMQGGNNSFSGSGAGNSRSFSTTAGSVGSSQANHPSNRPDYTGTNNSGWGSNQGFRNNQPGNRPDYTGTNNSSAWGGNQGYRNNNSVTSGNSSTRTPLVPVQPFNVNAGDGGGSDGKTVVCNCGSDAIMLTVRKEGPNTGRQR